MDDCYFCNYKTSGEMILFENEYAVCTVGNGPVLIDPCLIIPKAHRETLFDLTSEEWLATKVLLDQVKTYLDKKCSPDGCNLGWNSGQDKPFSTHICM